MIAEVPRSYLMIALLVVLYLLICLRVALRMSAGGRSFWKWLLITCVATAIPAMIVLTWGRKPSPPQEDEPGPEDAEPRPARDDRAAPPRCPHCGKGIVQPGADIGGRLSECPHCRLPVSEDRRG